MKNNSMYKYSFRRLLLLILGGGIFISVISILVNKYFNLSDIIVHMAHGIIMTSGLWLGCMSIVQRLWRRFPWEHEPVKHIVLEFLLITSYTMLFSFSLYKFEIWAGIIEPVERQLAPGIAITMLITYLITAIHEAIFFYFQWKENFSKSVRLERAKIEANYEALKAQVNPHFIFNSLNSLSTMVDDKPEAIEYIQNLSGFLRYLLNPDQKELVQLREEMEIVNSFVSLQKSRFRENLKFECHISDNLKDRMVPPLVIQMLVDNCLKHNIISKDKPLSINIKTEEDFIIVENNLQRKLSINSTSQGLKNIENRLAYFTSQKMEIIQTDKVFRVRLPLLAIAL